jgi:hypothetical protein
MLKHIFQNLTCMFKMQTHQTNLRFNNENWAFHRNWSRKKIINWFCKVDDALIIKQVNTQNNKMTTFKDWKICI